MKKDKLAISVLFLLVILLATACGAINSSDSPQSINGFLLRDGTYVYLEFQSGGRLWIYQKSSPTNNAAACTADGQWSQNGAEVNIKITQSYCSTNDYHELNGTYKQNGNCIERPGKKMCE